MPRLLSRVFSIAFCLWQPTISFPFRMSLHPFTALSSHQSLGRPTLHFPPTLWLRIVLKPSFTSILLTCHAHFNLKIMSSFKMIINVIIIIFDSKPQIGSKSPDFLITSNCSSIFYNIVLHSIHLNFRGFPFLLVYFFLCTIHWHMPNSV